MNGNQSAFLANLSYCPILAFSKVSIFLIERMAVFTTKLLRVCLLSVFLMGNCGEVFWVDASTIVADMMYIKPCYIAANKMQIRYSMRWADFAIQFKMPVPKMVFTTSPKPAITKIYFNFIEKVYELVFRQQHG
jgi:hypothetical protein